MCAMAGQPAIVLLLPSGSPYSPDRKGEHPQRHLAKVRGILQADAYSGFNMPYEGGAIQEAPCMAHIRRKFFDLMEAHQSPIATEAVERIARLYQIENEIKGRSADERRAVRAARARPQEEPTSDIVLNSSRQAGGRLTADSCISRIFY
jgi:hypothetical protein